MLFSEQYYKKEMIEKQTKKNPNLHLFLERNFSVLQCLYDIRNGTWTSQWEIPKEACKMRDLHYAAVEKVFSSLKL